MTEVKIEDMERAIRQLEAEGYVDVKIISCKYWRKRL